MALKRIYIAIIVTTYCCLSNCSPNSAAYAHDVTYSGVYGVVTRLSDVQTMPDVLFESGNVVFISYKQWKAIVPKLNTHNDNLTPDNMGKWDFLLPKSILSEHPFITAKIEQDLFYRADIAIDDYIVCLADLVNAKILQTSSSIRVFGCVTKTVTELPLRLDLGYGEIGAFIVNE